MNDNELENAYKIVLYLKHFICNYSLSILFFKEKGKSFCSSILNLNKQHLI